MTTPGVPGSRGRPVFEDLAQEALASTRQRSYVNPYGTQPASPPPLTPEERTEAEKVATEGKYCWFCGGAHAMPSTQACPRLASFELGADGKVRAGTFWPGTKWAKGRVVFAEDAEETGEGGDGG